MALQVWLPLTKDLRNQGLASLTSSGTPVFKNNGGKLGAKCLDLNTRVNFNCSVLANLENFSIAFWAKVNSDTSQSTNWVDVIGFTDVNRSSGSTGQLRWETCYASGYESRGISSHNNANDSIGTGFGAIIGANKNTWYHIALVVDYTSGTIKQYCDGIVVSTPAPTGGHLNGAFWLGESGKINGEIQDIRIYDHCLSSFEVKRIAQGLVLHYPLNRNGFGNENFILESHKVTSGSNASGITRTYESDGSMKIVSTSGNGNYASLGFAKSSNTSVGNNMIVGDTYCISCDVKIEIGTVLPTLFINSGNGYKQLKPVNGSITTNNWMRVYYTSTWAEPGTSYGNISLHLGFDSAIGTYYFKNFKLEKGSVPTTWCPNIADTNNMGLNSTTEYDCSGFCNNGTRLGTFGWTSNTPKYTVSTYMPKSALITHPRPVFGGTDQEWTCAMWVKLDNVTQTSQAMNNFNISNNIVHSPTPLLYLNDGTNDYYMYGSQAVSAEVWTHVVFVFKNSDGIRNIYINGVLKNNYGPNKTSIPKGIPDTVTVGTNLAGYISDYRVYATALSAEDVAYLYNASAYAGTDGAIYVAEYQEV